MAEQTVTEQTVAEQTTIHQGTSPFHRGEQQVQEKLGVRARMERFGRKVIRDFLPEQHRQFYAQLPFITVGHVDEQGRPWASIVAGKPGFIQSPDKRSLLLGTRPVPGDPLAKAALNSRLGLLGLEPLHRRRNRLNGLLRNNDADGLSVEVQQSFGNCPQYIHARTAQWVREPNAEYSLPQVERMSSLDPEARQLIQSADTFFVASATTDNSEGSDEPNAVLGADVSHRGGLPGFVGIDSENRLVVPDYPGNNHYNTLGNFVVNPLAGLLFVDFERGDLLMLTGSVQVVWEGPEVDAFQGAQRLWKFKLHSALRLRDRLPLRLQPGAASPNNALTGTWKQAQSRLASEGLQLQWRQHEVVEVSDETPAIRSFYLRLANGEALPTYRAGQHLPLRVTCSPGSQPQLRTYTLSSAPGDPLYRISVKREPGGSVSNFLHDNLSKGQVLEAQAPRGKFHFYPSGVRPALLLSAGVGITPMISMLRDTVQENFRHRGARSVTFLHSASKTDFRPFREELQQLAASAPGVVQVLSAIGKPKSHESLGVNFEHSGRIDATLLSKLLPGADGEVYLCGPPGFMQGMYDALRKLNVPDTQIMAEAFGPSALKRVLDHETVGSDTSELAAVASESLVQLSRSKTELLWTNKDGSLLEFAEFHGLEPAFGCRGGSCGSCAVRVVSGKVTYDTLPDAEIPKQHALLCMAKPAACIEKQLEPLVLEL